MRVTILVAVLTVVAGCGSSSSHGDVLSTFPAPTDPGDPAAEQPLGGTFADAGLTPPDAEAPKLLVYGSSDTSLYGLDPTTRAVSKIGDFDCVPSGTQAMTDIAVDAHGDIWGVSATAVWSLVPQGGAVHCASKTSLHDPSVRFYGLTFAPVGVIDPSVEVLVAGNTQGELWSIDASGALSQRGTLGTVPADDGNGHSYPAANVGKTWELSGDIVFLDNGGKPVGFATVRDCPSPPDTTGCSSVDTLVEIDVAALATAGAQNVTKAIRGKMVKGASCAQASGGSGFGRLYGIAAWGAKLYGFSRYGDLVEVESATGTACPLASPPGVQWSGAGVTTLAPVQPPPPK